MKGAVYSEKKGWNLFCVQKIEGGGMLFWAKMRRRKLHFGPDRDTKRHTVTQTHTPTHKPTHKHSRWGIYKHYAIRTLHSSMLFPVSATTSSMSLQVLLSMRVCVCVSMWVGLYVCVAVCMGGSLRSSVCVWAENQPTQTLIFYKKLEYHKPHGPKSLLDFAHFLAQKGSYQFLIFDSKKKFWTKMGQIFLK